MARRIRGLNPRPQTKKSTGKHLNLMAGVFIFLAALFSFFIVTNRVYCDTNVEQTRMFSPQQQALKTSIRKKPTIVDPEATDCLNLLKKFRSKELEAQVPRYNGNSPVDGSNTTFHKSFVTIANANTDRPFYVATHDHHIDFVRSQIFTKGLYYERRLTDRVVEVFQQKKQNHEDSIFLDVGANIGWFSLLAAANGATKVYSFEPNLQNTVRFCESLSLNGWSDSSGGYNDYDENVKVFPISKGVGNTEEEKSLYAMDHNPGSYTFVEKKHRKKVGTFQITTLDAFAQRHGWFESRPSIGFFKLDVERFELEVLEGALELLKAQIVENIEFEIKENLADEVKSKMVQLLLEAGYELYMYGGYMGPGKKVDQVYTNWKSLAKDIQQKKYGENLLFRLPVTSL